ncbi:MAG: hypothetical protein ABW185_16070 [Sedimenticola sp.]
MLTQSERNSGCFLKLRLLKVSDKENHWPYILEVKSATSENGWTPNNFRWNQPNRLLSVIAGQHFWLVACDSLRNDQIRHFSRERQLI